MTGPRRDEILLIPIRVSLEGPLTPRSPARVSWWLHGGYVAGVGSVQVRMLVEMLRWS
jgi:hypothetical protein